MKFYMACITAYKHPYGIGSVARTLIAENDEEAYLAAMNNCKATYPPEQGYVMHDADVEYLCSDRSDLVMAHPNGEHYTLTLSKKQGE